MPTYDVVVVGAGLAGLTTAIELAEAGARVHLTAKGMAATHWVHGGLDVAAPPGARTPREGVARLARRPGHPYSILRSDVERAITAHLDRLGEMGLPYHGRSAARLDPFPTAVGALRPVAIVPEGQAAGLAPWGADEGLLLLGIGRFRDFWPHYAARNLRGQDWPGGPAEIRSAIAELPGLAALHNLNALVLARHFDDPAWRSAALMAMRRKVPDGGRWRIALPAVIGTDRHAEALREAMNVLGHPVFEIPTLPPSIPGLRLFEALRARAVQAGVSVHLGFAVSGAEIEGRRVSAILTDATVRSLRLTAGAVVVATGGVAGGGFRASRDGSIREAVLGLPVEAPPRESWLAGDLYRGGSIGLETVGIRVDDGLRPVDANGEAVLENVRVVGSALAGMRYLTERCGDGVAVASAHRAAALLAGERRPARAARAAVRRRPRVEVA